MKESGLVGYEYFAFISHCSNDTKFANKLQRHLETYKLPVLLSRQYPRTPRKLSPVCREEEQRREALSKAKFLIVICSETSAQADENGYRHVDADVEAFVAANPDENRARVIPIIYREKGGARATACIPPGVKALDLLALDVLDKGYAQVCNQIVSRMVGIKPGILWNRWQRKARKNMAMAAAVAFPVLVAALVAIGGSLWQSLLAAAVTVLVGVLYRRWYTTPRIVNYERFIEAYNLPMGIRKLTAAEVACRARHYRFTYQGLRLVKVECCNSSGVPVRQQRYGFLHNDVSTIELFYNEYGKVNRQVWSDVHGVKLRELHYEQQSGEDWLSFHSPGGDYAESHLLTPTENGVNSMVSRYRVQRNAQGHITEVCYCDTSGKICTDVDGTYGVRYDVDPVKGVVTALYHLDKTSSVSNNNKGIAVVLYEYDKVGYLHRLTHKNEAGEILYNEELVATMQCKVDAHGNCTSIRYIAPDGKLALCREQIAEKRVLYDERGFVMEETYHGTTRQPQLNRKGYARCVYTRNTAGTITDIKYFDEANVPTLCRDLYHHEVRTVDEFGNCITSTYFEENDKPCLNRDWAHRITATYDAEGLLSSLRYYDTKGDAILCRSGYHVVKYIYDSYGNVGKETFYGTDEKPCHNRYGIACTMREFDALHNCLKESYYDKDGLPVLHCEKLVAATEYEYDEHHNKIKECNYGVNGRLCLNADYVATYEYAYNRQGALTCIECKDGDGKPCRNKKGVYREEWVRDGQGNIISARGIDLCDDTVLDVEYNYNERGQILECIYGENNLNWFCDTEKRAYDERGNLIQRRFIDKDGKPQQNRQGVAEYRFEYNESGACTAESYYNAEYAPCATVNGVCRKEIRYNPRGEIVGVAYYDGEGQPCLHTEGYAELKLEKNAAGLVTKARYLGLNQEAVSVDGYSIISYEYDAQGNMTHCRYLSAVGEPAESAAMGISSYTCEYDDYHNKVRERYFDSKGNACIQAIAKAAVLERIYDINNREISRTYRDAEGVKCIGAGGYCQRVTYYEISGAICKEEYYDCEGTLLTVTDEYHRRIYDADYTMGVPQQHEYLPETKYDKYYHESGLSQYAFREQHYDKDGKLRGEQFWGAGFENIINDNFVVQAYLNFSNPQLCEDNESYAELHLKRNERGQEEIEGYCNWDKQPCVPHWREYAYKYSEYDSQGRVTERGYLDQTKTFCMPQDKGYAKYTVEYDQPVDDDDEEMGTFDAVCYHDDGGDMVVAESKGYACKYTYYDIEKRVDEIRYADEFMEKICPPELGYASAHYQYDVAGRLVEVSYNDEESSLCEAIDVGYARKKWTYNSRGKLIKEEYFDKDGMPGRTRYKVTDRFLNKNGDCVYERITDTWNPYHVEEMFGELNMVATHGEDGCIDGLKGYDKNQNCRLIRRIIDCQKVETHTVYRYDDKEQLVEKTSYNGDLCCYTKKTEYLETGKKSLEAYYDADNEPTAGEAHYIAKRYTYDTKENCTQIDFSYEAYCSDLHYAKMKEDSWEIGYSLPERIQYRYDEQNRLIYEAYLDDIGFQNGIDATGKKTGFKGREYACITYHYATGSTGDEQRIARCYAAYENPPMPEPTPEEKRGSELRKFVEEELDYDTEVFDYYAFISYSSKDVTFANKLQQHIESFNMPTVLAYQYPRSPKKLRPIFRDRTDLEQGNLGKMLEKGLRSSKYLLVICSENSAQPNRFGKRYVDLEVNSFIALAPQVNKARVIPILYRESAATAVEDCIPPAVAEHGLSAIDMLKEGPARTFNKVISRMVNLDAKVLKNHKKRRLQRGLALAALLAGMLLTGLVMGGIYTVLMAAVSAAVLATTATVILYHRYARRVICYERYIEENNLPTGYGKLSPKEARSRAHHYRFTYRGPVLQKLEHCNATGMLIPEELVLLGLPHVAGIEYLYHETGEVEGQLWKDAHGHVLKMVKFKRSDKNDWISFYTPTGALADNHHTTPQNKGAAVKQYKVTRNAQGTITSVSYHDETGAPCPDNNGAWGMSYGIHETSGVVLSLHYLDKDGNPACNSNGIAGIEYDYDEANHLTGYTYLNADNAPTSGTGYYATARYITNSNGDVCGISYLGADGKPCLNSRLAATELYTRDTHGNITAICHYGVDDMPTLNSKGIYRIRKEYTREGRLAAEYHDGLNEEPIMGVEHFHKATYHYNQIGQCTDIRYYDTHGIACLNADGLHHAGIDYYDNGLIKTRLCFDTHEKPCCCNGGYHAISYHYDDHANVTEKQYLGIDGNNGTLANGVSCIAYRYDEKHNCVEECYYNAEDKPCYDTDRHIIGITAAFDELNNKTAIAYYSNVLRPHPATHGVAKEEWVYNQVGLPVEVSRFDAKGNLCADASGFAKTEWEYGADGRLTKEKQYVVYNNFIGKRASSERLYDAQGLREEEHRDERVTRFEYDNYGRVVKESYLSNEGEPVLNEQGYAGRCICYTAGGEVAAITRMGKDGQELCKSTYAYDAQGRVTCVQYTAENGIPAAPIACITREYDAEMNRTTERFSNANAQDCAHPITAAVYHEQIYDEQDREIAIIFRDANRQICNSAWGYAYRVTHYTEAGFIKLVQYFDADRHLQQQAEMLREPQHGNTVKLNKQRIGMQVHGAGAELEGYEYKLCCYDVAGKMTREEYHTTARTGPAYKLYHYDVNGRLAREEYRDANGQLCLHRVGQYAQRVLTYNDGGFLCAEAFFDQETASCNAHTGYARKEISYTHDNKVQCVTLYTIEFKTKREKVYGRIHYSYNEAGLLVSEEIRNADGETHSVNGYSRVNYLYDDAGKRIKEEFLDAEDKPRNHEKHTERIIVVSNSEGLSLINVYAPGFHATKTIHYDERGNVDEVKFSNEEGKANVSYDARHPHPAAHCVYKYDEANRMIREEYYDDEEKPYCMDAKQAALYSAENKRYSCAAFRYIELGDLTLQSGVFGDDTSTIPDKEKYPGVIVDEEEDDRDIELAIDSDEEEEDDNDVEFAFDSDDMEEKEETDLTRLHQQILDNIELFDDDDEEEEENK